MVELVRSPRIHRRRHQRGMRAIVVLAVATLTSALLAPVATAAPVPYTNTPNNGWWVNGRVNAVEIVGNRLIVGGNFSAAAGPNGATAPRANLAAFDLTTGNLLTGFRADTNGVVHALTSSGGGRVFVGGAFTTIAGVPRGRLAEVQPDTGTVQAFRADATSTVLALRTAGTRLYVGGMFGNLGGHSRPKMGAVDLGTGTVVAGFSPSFDHHVRAITTLGNRVWAAGQFGTVNGTERPSLVELDGAGRLVGPRYDVTDMLWDVDVSPDGTRIFGAVGGTLGRTRLANSAVAFSTTTGAWQWRVQSEGDVQAIKHLAGNVYFGFHEGYQGDFEVHLLAADAATGQLTNFQPVTGGFWGVWAITGDANRLVAGGEFRSLAGPQRNLAVYPAGGGTTTPPGPSPSTGTTVIPMNAAWRYRPFDAAMAATWMQPGYNDSAWPSGRAKLGFGEGDETTLVARGSAIHWFRTAFHLSAAPTGATLDLLVDDGAVVYVNGREVLRDNVAEGPLSGSTRAATTRWGTEETIIRRYGLAGSLFREGTNVVAVAVYLDCTCSSDMAMAASLAVTSPQATTTTTTTTRPTTTTTKPTTTTTRPPAPTTTAPANTTVK